MQYKLMMKESKIKIMTHIQVRKRLIRLVKPVTSALGKVLSGRFYAVFQSEKEKQFSNLLHVDELD